MEIKKKYGNERKRITTLPFPAESVGYIYIYI